MKRILIVTVLIFCICGSACAISVSAKSAILMEASTGKVLFSQDIDTKRGMASTTKIMTALIVLESADLEELVTVKQSCTGIEGSSMYLQPGEQLTVSDLLYGLMLQSGNDCATVLADHVAGSTEQFVSLMNQKAADLGLCNTHFTNPSGLPDKNHYSSASDMAHLTAYAMQNADFRAIVATKKFRAGTHYLVNHNRLLSMCEGVDGVKTGFTKSAGRCLVSSAVRNGVRLIAVTLNAPDDWRDHKQLYDFGFANIKQIQFHQAGEELTSLPVIGGVSSELPILIQADCSAMISPEEEKNIQVVYHLPHFLYAPILKGEEVGEVIIKVGNEVVMTVPLTVSESVAQLEPQGWFHRLSYSIRKRFLA